LSTDIICEEYKQQYQRREEGTGVFRRLPLAELATVLWRSPWQNVHYVMSSEDSPEALLLRQDNMSFTTVPLRSLTEQYMKQPR